MPFRDDLFAGSLADASRKYLGRNTLEDPRPEPVDDSRPLLHGYGPAEFSTDTRLTIQPQVCWDANGYYRTLGVHWRASKKELREAFIALGPNPSAWQMYVLRQLLDPVVRRIYDLTPLGERFIDEYVRDELAREAHRRTGQMRAQGMSITAEEVLDQMGYRSFDDTDDESPETVDGDAVDDEDDVVPPDDRKPPAFNWAYYLWRTRKIDVGRLAQWQELLVAAFASRGERIRLAVGLHGAGPHPWVVGEVGYRTVVFLNHREQPDAAMAQAVVDRITNDPAGSRKALQ